MRVAIEFDCISDPEPVDSIDGWYFPTVDFWGSAQLPNTEDTSIAVSTVGSATILFVNDWFLCGSRTAAFPTATATVMIDHNGTAWMSHADYLLSKHNRLG